MFKALVPGDVVTVTRIDRLARSTFNLFAIVKQIVDRQRMVAALETAGDPLAQGLFQGGRAGEAAFRMARTSGDYPRLSGGDGTPRERRVWC